MLAQQEAVLSSLSFLTHIHSFRARPLTRTNTERATGQARGATGDGQEELEMLHTSRSFGESFCIYGNIYAVNLTPLAPHPLT